MSGILTTRKALAGALTCLLTAACGTPVAPSAPRPAAAPSVTAIASSGSSSFATSGVDLARCLQSATDAGCFSGARPVVRAAVAGATAPSPPGTLTATASGSSVTLTWGAPASGDPVITYIIEAGSASGLSNLANVATNSTATTFSASGVANGTYYVRVRAQNAAGTSAASNEAILVVCTSAPGASSGLTSSVSGSTVTLTWNAASGSPTTYLVEAGSASGLANLVNSDLGGTATTLRATNVGAGTYYVRIRARNACGTSGASNEVIVTIGSITSTSLSGRWIGVAPDGVNFDPQFSLCDIADDLQLDLTQIGTALSGTIALRTRTAKTSGCDPIIGPTLLTNGTTDGTSVSFRLTGATGKFLTFSGAVSANRMSGVVIAGGDGSQAGTFAATRQ